MLTDFDRDWLAWHWQVQLEFTGGAPGDALRMQAVLSALQQILRPRSEGSALDWPQYALLAPAGTREQLCHLSGRPCEDDGALPAELQYRDDDASRALRDGIEHFESHDAQQRCLVLSTLLECCLYSVAAALLDREVEVDAAQPWDAWFLYQVGRLIQRVGPELGQPDDYFEAVALHAPHAWQRCAAIGQMVARYARIAPSMQRLEHWSGAGYALLAEMTGPGRRDTGDKLDVNALWGSRLLRALALAEVVAQRPVAAARALDGCEELHHQASAPEGPASPLAAHLLATNLRFLTEARLKRAAPADALPLAAALLEVDPGCADVHHFVGMMHLRRQEAEPAARHLQHSYRMGTRRAPQSALALARVNAQLCDAADVAALWIEAARRLDPQVEVPADLRALT